MSALPDVTQSTFSTQVLASDKPVLVDFWAPWCRPCTMLLPVVQKVAGQLGERVSFVKLNIDENPSFAGEYGIPGIPYLILFKGGQAVDRIGPIVSENTIKQMLDKHLAAADGPGPQTPQAAVHQYLTVPARIDARVLDTLSAWMASHTRG